MSSIQLFVLVSGISAASTALVIWIARKRGWLFHPRAERWHRTPVAKFGGVAIIFSLVLGTVLAHTQGRTRTLIALVVAMGALGLADDIFQLRARYKLFAQVVIASLAVWGGIIYPTNFSWIISAALTVLWLVGITNAFNLLDNMDGLSAGVGIICAANLMMIVSGRGDAMLAPLLLVMCASLTGFLLFNFHPAKIFMGDAGSLAIGFFFAGSTVLGAGYFSSVFSVLFVPALVLFLPIFDVVLVSVTRRLGGRAISAGAKDHTSHRLVMLGLSERGAVLTLYVIAAAGGLVAYAWKTRLAAYGPGLLGMFFVVGVLFWLHVAKISLPEEWLSRDNVFILAIPTLMHTLARRAGMVAMDVMLICISMYTAFVLRTDAVDFYMEQFLIACTLAIAIKITLLALYSAYSRAWRVETPRDVYPIFKACVASMLLLIAVLTFTTRFHDFSRAVFVIDLVCSLLLLSGVRASGRMFDDALPKANRRSYLLVCRRGNESTRLWLQSVFPDDVLVAMLSPEGTPEDNAAEVPHRPLAELKLLLEPKIQTVYVETELGAEVVVRVQRECAEKQVSIKKISVSIEEVGSQVERSAAMAATARLG